MRFTMERGPALEAVALLTAVVPSKITVPILGNVRLDTADGFVSITATDLDMRLTVDVPAIIARPGGITIEANRLHQILRAMPEGADFTLDFGDEPKAKLSAGRSRYVLNVLPANDFPMIYAGMADATAEVESKALARLLGLGSAAVSREDSLVYLMSTYLHTIGGQLRAVSTDRKRVQYAQMPAPEGFDHAKGVMLHPRTVAIMNRLLAIASTTSAMVEQTATLGFGENKVSLGSGRVKLVSKVLGGEGEKYVDYQRILPKDAMGDLLADTDLLIGCVTRVMITADRKDTGLKLDVTAGQMTISSRDEEANACTEELEVEWDGEDFSTMLNGNHVAAMLAQVRTEQTLIRPPIDHIGVTIGETGESDWYGLTVKFKGW